MRKARSSRRREDVGQRGSRQPATRGVVSRGRARHAGIERAEHCLRSSAEPAAREKEEDESETNDVRNRTDRRC